MSHHHLKPQQWSDGPAKPIKTAMSLDLGRCHHFITPRFRYLASKKKVSGCHFNEQPKELNILIQRIYMYQIYDACK